MAFWQKAKSDLFGNFQQEFDTLPQIKAARQKNQDKAQQTESLREITQIDNDSASGSQLYSLQPKKGGRLQPME